MSAEIYSATVKMYGTDAGAVVVGIASSDGLSSAPDGSRPSDVLKGCRSVIILGIPFTQDSLLGDTADYTNVRTEMVKRTGVIAEKVAKRVKSKGYRTVTVTSCSTKISLKHAAEQAGLGVIGRNYLLINPEHGNLLWFSAVLTDASLEPDRKVHYSVCADCSKCVEICPSKALDDPGRFGKKKCSDTCMKLTKNNFEIACFLCRKVCPYRFGIPS
ncbi:MAG: hypothetical protein FWH44_02450 [Methanomassiliicoccaceae archaeon]|nr:hypothetical protein [Methanomassiliicoccaceae archaeon]